MVDAAISGARQLIDAPLDPKGNDDNQRSTHSYGIAALSRALLKFERWDELLDAKTIPWRDILLDKMNKAYFQTRAHLGKGKIEAAEKSFALHAELKKDIEKEKSFERVFGIQQNELKGRIAIGRGDTILGLSLLATAADANPGIPSVERAKASGVTADPRDASPAPQRNYRVFSLERFGPQRWEPYEAPELDVRDSSGKNVTLASYKGKNVLLVFYLGHDCPHCVRQLHDIVKKKDDWERLNTEVLAVSNAAPEINAKALKEFGALPVRLLSDDHFANARRFHSYDDFEEIELHSTILIDKQGRVQWARTGGEPFSDLAFLEKQLGKMNQ